LLHDELQRLDHSTVLEPVVELGNDEVERPAGVGRPHPEELHRGDPTAVAVPARKAVGWNAAPGVPPNDVVDRERLAGPRRAEEGEVEPGRSGGPSGGREERCVGEGVLLEDRDERDEVEFLSEESLQVPGELLDVEGLPELHRSFETVPEDLAKAVQELPIHRPYLGPLVGYGAERGGLHGLGAFELVEQQLAQLLGVRDLVDLLAFPFRELEKETPSLEASEQA